jgi:uncharacterized membrane protein
MVTGTVALTEKAVCVIFMNGGLIPVRPAGPVVLFIGYDAGFFYFALIFSPFSFLCCNVT